MNNLVGLMPYVCDDRVTVDAFMTGTIFTNFLINHLSSEFSGRISTISFLPESSKK